MNVTHTRTLTHTLSLSVKLLQPLDEEMKQVKILFIGYFPQKSPINRDSFAKNEAGQDSQKSACYSSSYMH